jgi:hypothetical protein
VGAAARCVAGAGLPHADGELTRKYFQVLIVVNSRYHLRSNASEIATGFLKANLYQAPARTITQNAGAS